MKTHLLGMSCFSIFALSASMAHASVAYKYQGEGYDQVSGVYDTTMSLTGNVEFTTSLPANLFQEVFPISFRFDDGVNTITDENATSSRFGFATDNLGDIIGWQISVKIEEGTGIRGVISDKLMLYSQDVASNLTDTFGGLAGNRDNPGSWTVVPIPPAILLLGSGLLGLIIIARRKAT